MRPFVSLAVLGIIASASVPAAAQQQTATTPGSGYATTQSGYTQSAPVYTAPIYNSASNNYYQPNATGTPFYNNSPSARPLALNQMVAGKDAPSYNYNRNQSYNGYGDPLANMDMSAMTPEQARLVRAQRNARAQQAQAGYLASLQAQKQQQLQMQQQPGALTNPYLQGAGQMYNQFAEPEPEKPKQRRVVYKEMNNPLVTPPRLFDPDQ